MHWRLFLDIDIGPRRTQSPFRNPMLRALPHIRTPLLRLPSRLFSATRSRQADPWPLPHTAQHLEATRTPEDSPLPSPLPRPNEAVETMRARLVYQSRKRGTLESDLLLSTFARDVLGLMGQEEMREYDKVCGSLTSLLVSFPDDGWWPCVFSVARRTRLGHLLLGDEQADASGTMGEFEGFGEAQGACAK